MISGENSMILGKTIWFKGKTDDVGEKQIILFWWCFISGPIIPSASLESRYFVMGQSSIIVDKFYKLWAIGHRRGLVQTSILSVAKTVWFRCKTVWLETKQLILGKIQINCFGDALYWVWACPPLCRNQDFLSRIKVLSYYISFINSTHLETARDSSKLAFYRSPKQYDFTWKQYTRELIIKTPP